MTWTESQCIIHTGSQTDDGLQSSISTERHILSGIYEFVQESTKLAINVLDSPFTGKTQKQMKIYHKYQFLSISDNFVCKNQPLYNNSIVQ